MPRSSSKVPWTAREYSTSAMTKKVQWGVLGAANIAVQKVIPAMQRGEWCEVAALASRNLEKAQRFALELGILKVY